MASLRSRLRRATTVLLLCLVALALLPGVADAAQPATLRLVGHRPGVPARCTVTTPNGTRVTASPGLFRLRVTPGGRRGRGAARLLRRRAPRDHRAAPTTRLSLRTAADDPRLASARYAEAGMADPAGRGADRRGRPRRPRPRGRRAAGGRLAAHRPGPRESTRPPTPPSTPAPPPSARWRRAAPSAVPSRSRRPRRAAAPAAAPSPSPSPARPAAPRPSRSTGGTGAVSPAEVRFGADGTRRRRRHLVHPRRGHRHRALRGRHASPASPAPARAPRTPQETMVLVPAVVLGDRDGHLRRLPGDPVRGPRHGPDDPGTPGVAARRPGTPFENPATPAASTPGAVGAAPPHPVEPHLHRHQDRPGTAAPGSDASATRSASATARAPRPGRPHRHGRPARGHVARRHPGGLVACAAGAWCGRSAR